jgi:hypothetical protein
VAPLGLETVDLGFDLEQPRHLETSNYRIFGGG